MFSLDTPQVVNTFYLESDQHGVDIEVGDLLYINRFIPTAPFLPYKRKPASITDCIPFFSSESCRAVSYTMCDTGRISFYSFQSVSIPNFSEHEKFFQDFQMLILLVLGILCPSNGGC